MQDIKEPELIAQSLHGDTKAYGQLVDRYKQAIYCHCFAMVHDEDAAEDMAQETFIAAYYNLKRYNNTFRFSTWLFKISTNKCLNYLRDASRKPTVGDKLLETIVSAEPTPDRHAEAAELRAAVSELKPKYQAVISLYYWQGLSYKDIALLLDVPINSVRVWLSRAKQQLRKELA